MTEIQIEKQRVRVSASSECQDGRRHIWASDDVADAHCLRCDAIALPARWAASYDPDGGQKAFS